VLNTIINVEVFPENNVMTSSPTHPTIYFTNPTHNQFQNRSLKVKFICNCLLILVAEKEMN